MSGNVFQLSPSNVSVNELMEQIRKTVAKKMEEGAYSDVRVAQAEKTNLAGIKEQSAYLDFYLELLRDTVFVDINDFDIVERRAGLAFLSIPFKKMVWKCLKFYTYRLWSQQNQINGLLLGAVECVDSMYRDKIRKLEERLAALESR